VRMLYEDEFVSWVPFSVEHVFLFFASPQNLPRLMPPWMDTRIEELRLVLPVPAPPARNPSTPIAGVGSEIVTSFRVLPLVPFRKTWIARITEFEWNGQFADIQAQGPFKSWLHRHKLAPEVRNGVQGSVVRDRIQYEIGFGFLGRIGQALFVSRQLKATFAHRQSVLPGLLRQN
jgi:ligand-binding SRPBCC domain-containing protein